MKALRLLLIAVAILVAALLIGGLIAPNEVHVKRSVSIKAPPAAVFANLQYIDKVAIWHPLLKKDPNVLTSAIGEDGTVGAIRRWESEIPEVGRGEETILEVEKNAYLKSKVEVMQPRSSEGISSFSLVDYGGNTQVIWEFKYEIPYPWNAFMIFNDGQDELGAYFSNGLTGLKNILERRERRAVNYLINDHDLRGNSYAIIRETIDIDRIEDFAEKSLEDLTQKRSDAGLNKAGFPAGFIYEWNTEEGKVDYAFGIPVPEEGALEHEDYLTVEGTNKAKTLFINDLYGDRENAHRAIRAQMTNSGLDIIYPALEIYMKGQLSEFPEDNSATRLVYRYE